MIKTFKYVLTMLTQNTTYHTMKQMSFRNLDLENLIKKSELSFREQLKRFINETGKHLALGIIFIITFIVTGQIIPQSLYITTFIIVPIIITALVIYIIVYFYNKYKEEMRGDFLALAQSHKRLGDEFTNSIMQIEQKLIGRIKALEAYSPYAIMELDGKGNILRTNPHFEYLFGWNENTLNAELSKFSPDQRSERLSYLLAEPSDQQRLQIEFFSRLKGDIENKEYKDLYFKQKSGNHFPGSVHIAIIHDERGYITQYFISDDTNIKAMMETINGQNDTINRLIGVFAHLQSEKAYTDDLIIELEQLKSEIHDKARR